MENIVQPDRPRMTI